MTHNETEPAVWRWTYSIEEGGRMMGPFYGERAPDLSDWPNAVVMPLYAHPLHNPSPSDGEVSDVVETKIEEMIAGAASLDDYDNGYRDACREVLTILQSKRGQP